MLTAFVQFLAQESRALEVRLMVIAGQAGGGQPYAALRKGGPSGVFERLAAQVRLIGASTAVRPGAVLLLHGETDGALGTPGYDAILRRWQADFRQDLGAALGSEWTAPLLYCQTSSISGYCSGARRGHFRTPLAQLRAQDTRAGRVLVGPKYAFDYIDWAHLDAPSTRLHGEYFGKVLAQLRRGEDWSPVVARAVVRDGLRLRVSFDVPCAPLVLDTGRVSDPGACGFDLDDPRVRITGVALCGPRMVELTLNTAPRRGSLLSYALTNGEAGRSGRPSGTRGCLRDSDATPSAFGDGPLFNWCTAFALPLPDA